MTSVPSTGISKRSPAWLPPNTELHYKSPADYSPSPFWQMPSRCIPTRNNCNSCFSLSSYGQSMIICFIHNQSNKLITIFSSSQWESKEKQWQPSYLFAAWYPLTRHVKRSSSPTECSIANDTVKGGEFLQVPSEYWRKRLEAHDLMDGKSIFNLFLKQMQIDQTKED